MIGFRIQVLGAMIGLYTLRKTGWNRRTTEVCFHRLYIRRMIGSGSLLGPAFEFEAEV